MLSEVKNDFMNLWKLDVNRDTKALISRDFTERTLRRRLKGFTETKQTF